MKKLGILLLSFCILNSLGVPAAWAVFSLSVDSQPLSFDVMDPGQTKELISQGNYHNEVTCQSTNGTTWYLKIHVTSPFTSGSGTIPLENFQWMLSEVQNGTGSSQNIGVYNAFTTSPALVYISGSSDNSGNQVKARFKYQLILPANQTSGVYSTIVRYTLTETL